MHISYYQDKIYSNSITLTSLNKKLKRIPFLKLFCFLIAVLFITAPFVWEWHKLTCFIIAAVNWILFFILHTRDTKLSNQRHNLESINAVYQHEIEALQGNFKSFYNGERFLDKSHEYTFDLDVFGDNSLYHRINRTTTYEAASILADRLKTIPQTTDEVRCQQQALTELSSKTDFRTHYLAICNNISREPINYNLLNEHKSTLLTTRMSLILIILSTILTLASILLSALNIFSWSIPGLLFMLQLFAPMLLFRKMNKASLEAGWLHKTIKQYSRLLQLINGEDFENQTNKQLKNKLFLQTNSLTAFNTLSALLEKFEQRNNSYALLIFNGLFLRDLFLLRSFNLWRLNYLEYIQSWITTLAEMEVQISLANFIFNYPQYCLPQLIDTPSDTLINTKAAGHPFIPFEKVVGNDFTIQKGQFSIITGANMSGKSTFLRTIGINYILAVNGMKVCAKEFQFSLFNLFSSMRNADDLTLGVSYFNAELNRIEKLIQFTKNQNHTLIILDEILKGTNSKDKLAGSILFLQTMTGLPVTGIIATHDLELSKLEDECPEIYQNYCFEINLSETIQYSYTLEKGISKNMNATFLLNNILKK